MGYKMTKRHCRKIRRRISYETKSIRGDVFEGRCGILDEEPEEKPERVDKAIENVFKKLRETAKTFNAI